MGNAFAQVIGYETVKNELYQIIDMFKNPQKYEKMGARLPKNVLLYAEPGMGKSLLCKCFIDECGVKSFKYTRTKEDSETLKDIAQIFEDAAKQEPSIIFFDDIDKFSESEDCDVDDKVFVAIQSGIDSVKDKNVLVLATANHFRKLPSSLRRNGRFDRKIELSTPNQEDARKIIEYYLKNKCVDPSLNYEDISKMISYTSCATLETLMNESAIIAAYAGKDKIDIEDIVKVYLDSQYDSSDETLECSEEEFNATCLHEAGHAVIAETIKPGCVGCVTVKNNGNSNKGGFTSICDHLTRRPENALVGLGGKVACELYLSGRTASGCQNDLYRVADMIRDGISESGTCGIGMFDVANNRFPNTSESLTARNEAVTHAELERTLSHARDILIKNKDFLFKMYENLKKKKTLLYSDIKAIRESVVIIPTYVQ